MEVLSLQIFVSLVLVLASILLFAFAAKGRDHEHAERLALLPLDEARRGPPPGLDAPAALRAAPPEKHTEEPS